MPKKNSYITVTDQFCGAGGSSQGVRRFAQRNRGGIEVKLALNHWKLAIETHNTNFPDTYHDCTDISACDPRRYMSTDILITSPECTNHSLAKGKKIVQKQMDLFDSGKLDASAERSRATMWDVPRFAEYHSYNIIIVENVVDARKWVMFDAWLQAMHSLGYNHKCVYLNSMHCHPTPQSRDRMYVVFWKKGNKAPMLDYTPPAYCAKCGKDVHSVQTWKNPLKKFGKYKQQYVYCCPACTSVVEPYYYAAFNCIDWSDIGKRIGDRSKPLSPNTIKRIEFGLKKYGKESFIIHRAYGSEARGVWKSVSEPAFTQTTVESQALINPFLIDGNYDAKPSRIIDVSKELPTSTTQPRIGIAFPFITLNEHTKVEPQVRKITEPIQTHATRQTMGLVMPFILNYHHSSKANSITDAIPTQCTNDKYGLITTEAFNSFISYYYGQDQASNITEPIGTATTKERHSIVSFKEPTIEDCYYRMLKAGEVKLAMAFDNNYIILGSSKDQVKQCGNAVTPPAMEWLIERSVESLN